ncbi:MAG: type II toxin-antitoxin system RelE/ParE family toxin [Cyanobacteria bacterium SZAS LIN-2]|nr:type II toxin-antitoxin system RelE/ParE family toxin [Cyanobacteria bacterium SZAS LIN-2]
MIKSFRHKGIERFFHTGSASGINAAHAARLRRQLALLNEVTHPKAMDIPGWKWHSLKGELAGHWSVTVNANWRLTFAFDGDDAILVDYQDYH